MLDLDARHSEKVRRILAEHVPECEVRAFGSRTTGEARSWSDLDLLVMGPERLDPRRIWRLLDAFEESDLPFRVDVVDWNAASESFRAAVGAAGPVIYRPTASSGQ
ncbi:MAG: nucleotidyltransferase domain-containing protein [Kiritimatiellaeota bacterium]|nr:nucleotidyltransferase domain-containing protein [Kiritimatiellota bacterium]